MNLIKRLMAKLSYRYFRGEKKPNGEVVQEPLNKLEILEELARYKAQNPVKYEQKKAALFARYGLSLEEEPTNKPDANDVELEVLKAATKKAKKVAPKTENNVQ